MEFRLLGPVEVRERDRSLPLGGVKPRSLLAILLLHANEVVSTDRLHAALWGEAEPATAAKSIHIYVSRLRAQLGPDRLTTRAPGYVLRVEPGRARRGPVRATASRRRAQRRARGGRADAARGACAVAGRRARRPRVRAVRPGHVQRLEELRLVAIEERIDADLAAGRAARARRRARGADRRASPARAAERPADARAVPLGPPGRGSERVPTGAPRALRGARARAERGAPAARAGDPPPGPRARRARPGIRPRRPGGEADPGPVRPRRSRPPSTASTRCSASRSRWPPRSPSAS